MSTPYQRNPKWEQADDPGTVTVSRRETRCADCGRPIHLGDRVLLRNYKPHCPDGCDNAAVDTVPTNSGTIHVTEQKMAIPDGHYTLKYGEDELLTIRVHTIKQATSSMNGKTLAYILNPDVGEWVAFAFVGDDDLIHPWRKYSDNETWTAAAEALLDPELQEVARRRYRESLSK